MMLKKVCLLGEIAVGKTSLIRRYVDRRFSDAYFSTVGVQISRKLLTVRDGPGCQPTEMQLILWDIEGGLHPRVGSPSYLKGAHGAVVVGDLSRPATFEGIDKYISLFREFNPGSVVMIALNKADLARPTDHPASLRETPEGAPVMVHTSAKTGEGVDALFEALGVCLLGGVKHGPAH